MDEGKSRDRHSHPTLTLLDKCLLSFGYLESKILFHLSRNFKITSPLTLISSFLTTIVLPVMLVYLLSSLMHKSQYVTWFPIFSLN